MIRTLVLLAVLAGIAVSAPIVNLKIKETAGVARLNEDITMGVPLPEGGAYTDTSRFTLRDGTGNIIPCEFKSLSTWFKHPTYVRWLQLNFPYSMAANDSQVITLNSEAGVPPVSKLTAVDNGTTITVNTGKIRFIVKKANFNIIDQAWVDESGAESYTAANQIVVTHTRGLVFYDSLDGEFLSSNDAASTVTVTRRGSGTAVLTARGLLKNTGGVSPLHFICRIYAFNNSSSVRIYHTIENWNTTVTTYAGVKGLQVELPLNLGATKNGVVGKPGGYDQSSSADLFCMVKRPDTSTTTMGQQILGSNGGATASTFDPKTLKPKDIGWAALSDGTRGCMVAMKYFWQMVPASAEALTSGRLVLGLFSKRSNQQFIHLYAGGARTYETLISFFNTLTPDQVRSKAVGTTDRLFAVASPEWYSRIAMAAYPMMETGKQTYYTPTNWTAVFSWQNRIRNQWTSVLNADNSWIGYDSYGFLEWGDNPHYNASISAGGWINTFPYTLLWNGNYYGLPYMSFEHFFATGDLRFLNYGIAHARHVQDIHLVHFGPSSIATGGSRYSPPAYHFCTDDDPINPASGQILGSYTTDNPSHHQVEGVFLDYFLTGNDYGIEVAMQGADWFNRSGTSFTAPGQELGTYIRRWSHQMYSQIWAYEYTRNAKYYNQLYQNWEAMKNNIRTNQTIGQQFMIGFAMEALVKMYGILSPTYRTTGGVDVPDSIPYFLKIWADRVALMPLGTSSTSINSNVTLGFAFLSKFYDAPTYQGLAIQRAATAFGGNLHKDFAQQARNMENAMYYMAIPDSVIVTSAEKPADEPMGAALGLSISPVPFNPTALISLTGYTFKKGIPVSLRVYSPAGELVADLSQALDAGKRSVIFHADGLASGVYMVRCEAGASVITKKMTLIK